MFKPFLFLTLISAVWLALIMVGSGIPEHWLYSLCFLWVGAIYGSLMRERTRNQMHARLTQMAFVAGFASKSDEKAMDRAVEDIHDTFHDEAWPYFDIWIQKVGDREEWKS